MQIAVIADLMALRDFAAQYLWMLQRIFADDEEGGGCMPFLEDIEDLRRPCRIRPVVEGERDHLRACAGPGDLIRCRKHPIDLVRDEVLLAELHGAFPAARGCGDAQHLAITLDIGIQRALQGTQIWPAALAKRREVGPYARILTAEPPQRHALYAQLPQHLELVPARNRVQHPDLMMLAILIIGEGGIATAFVELDGRRAVMGGDPRFF